MTLDDLERYFVNSHRFELSTGISHVNWHNWFYKYGYIPIKSQMRIEKIVNGELQADFSHILDKKIGRIKVIKADRELAIEYVSAKSKLIDSGCIVWVGSIGSYGYASLSNPSLKSKFKVSSIHRLVYAIHYPDFDRSLFVCHRCDNRKCVNIEHLFLGNPSDNSKDMTEKQRQFRPNHKGSNHPNTRLNFAKVKSIRSHKGIKSARELSLEFGVTVGCIESILSKKSWNYPEAFPDE